MRSDANGWKAKKRQSGKKKNVRRRNTQNKNRWLCVLCSSTGHWLCCVDISWTYTTCLSIENEFWNRSIRFVFFLFLSLSLVESRNSSIAHNIIYRSRMGFNVKFLFRFDFISTILCNTNGHHVVITVTIHHIIRRNAYLESSLHCFVIFLSFSSNSIAMDDWCNQLLFRDVNSLRWKNCRRQNILISFQTDPVQEYHDDVRYAPGLLIALA